MGSSLHALKFGQIQEELCKKSKVEEPTVCGFSGMCGGIGSCASVRSCGSARALRSGER